MPAYLHCGGCKRAFDAAAVACCPHCGQRLGGEPEPDSLEDRVADAAARIASALARATVEERAALQVALGRRMLAAETAAEETSSPLARWLPASLAAVQRAIVTTDATVAGRTLPPGDARPAWLGVAARVVTRLARPLPAPWKRRARRVLEAFA
jgi:hypothetical protein